MDPMGHVPRLPWPVPRDEDRVAGRVGRRFAALAGMLLAALAADEAAGQPGGLFPRGRGRRRWLPLPAPRPLPIL